jgi:hypothetical protein
MLGADGITEATRCSTAHLHAPARSGRHKAQLRSLGRACPGRPAAQACTYDSSAHNASISGVQRPDCAWDVGLAARRRWDAAKPSCGARQLTAHEQAGKVGWRCGRRRRRAVPDREEQIIQLHELNRRCAYNVAICGRTYAQLRRRRIIERTVPDLLPKAGRVLRRSLKQATRRTLHMSAAARKAVSRRMKRYWAERRKAQAKIE